MNKISSNSSSRWDGGGGGGGVDAFKMASFKKVPIALLSSLTLYNYMKCIKLVPK